MTREKATFSTIGPLPIAYQIERMAAADVPDHLREEREEGGEDVGDGEVQDEEVHASHLRPAKWIDICSFVNAPKIFTAVIGVFSSLCIPALFRTDHVYEDGYSATENEWFSNYLTWSRCRTWTYSAVEINGPRTRSCIYSYSRVYHSALTPNYRVVRSSCGIYRR